MAVWKAVGDHLALDQGNSVIFRAFDSRQRGVGSWKGRLTSVVGPELIGCWDGSRGSSQSNAVFGNFGHRQVAIHARRSVKL